MINALKYTRSLEAVGFSREQAETHVQMISEIVEGDLATKQDLLQTEKILRQDLHVFEQGLRQDIQLVEQSLKQEIHSVRSDMRHEVSALENKMVQLEYRMTIKMGAMATATVGILAALIKLG